MSLLRYATPLLLVALVPAQGIVSPAHFTHAEGNAPNRYPFGEHPNHVFRYLQVHDDTQGTPRPIRSLAWRRWGAPCTTGGCTVIYPAYQVTLDAWCSTAATTSATAVAQFDANHGGDKVKVIDNKTFNFPVGAPGQVPQPFAYKITFDVPFIYLAAAPICWEVNVHAKTNTIQLYHSGASGSQSSPQLATAPFGTGCRATGQSVPMSAVGSSTMAWAAGTGNLVVDGFRAPANGVVILLVGFRNDTFGGIPLPFLVPGSAAAPSGPCSLYTDVRFTVAGIADSAGTIRTTIPIPATLDLNGARAFEQVISFDPAANPVGLVASNGVVHNFVAPHGPAPVTRVFLNGSLGANGSVGRNYGLVTRFDL
jgi:hypothetical protein